MSRSAPSLQSITLSEAMALFRAKRTDVSMFLKTCDAVARYRQQARLTQKELAAKFKGNVRQIKTCEKLAALPPEARTLILQHKERFTRTFLTLDVASRKFADKRTLINVLKRRIEGQKPRKRPTGDKDIYLVRLEDRLRDQFHTKVSLDGDTFNGEIRLKYLSPEELERISEMLLPDPKRPGARR